MEWLTTAWEWVKEAFNSGWLTNVLLLGILFEISARGNAIDNRIMEILLNLRPK